MEDELITGADMTGLTDRNEEVRPPHMSRTIECDPRQCLFQPWARVQVLVVGVSQSTSQREQAQSLIENFTFP